MSDAHKTPTPSSGHHREEAQDAGTKYGKTYPSDIGDHDGLSSGGTSPVIGEPLTHEAVRNPARRPEKSDGKRFGGRDIPTWLA